MISKLLQTYWKVFRPKTFGVKALILHPSDPGLFLAVRHSYTDQKRWGLPGGGYRRADADPGFGGCPVRDRTAQLRSGTSGFSRGRFRAPRRREAGRCLSP
ncbi:MAG TPA: hypothetical protein VN408_33735, partial [Actinoplanes sp.]|nr:hypothetical protein [Actinoplanes sp.]